VVTAITTREVIRLVVEQHPLVASQGHVVCTGCHLILAYPEHHIGEVLAEVLDPAYVPPKPKSEAGLDPRESQIEWRAS
jgi:hypothetical protein